MTSITPNGTNAFLDSPLIQKELSAFAQRCSCTQYVEERRAALHRELSRVIVIDLRFAFWGIGNSLPRWLGLLRCGLAAGRATFLWMSDQQQAALRPAGSARHQKAVQRFDLGEYFHAIGGDWRWTAEQEARVRAVQGDDKPLEVRYTCLQQAAECDRFQLRWGNAESSSLEGSLEQERDGMLVAWLSARREPWLLLNLRPKWQTALMPSAAAAALVLSGEMGTSWGGGWGAEGGCAAAHRSDTQPRLLRWRSAGSSWHLPQGVNVSRRLRHEPVLASHGVLRGRLSGACEAFALLRPRPVLQRALKPLLKRMGHAKAVAGLHMRTGLADWQALSHSTAAAAEAWETAQKATPLPFAEHWKRFEDALVDCAQVGIPLGGRPRQVAAPACFHWHSQRGPTLADGLRCRGSEGLRSFSAPSTGPLAAAFACAGSYASREAAPTNAAAWSVLVLGDAPGLATLARSHYLLREHVVHTPGERALGHTAFRSACLHGDCSTGVDPHGAWTRTMVEFYAGGLCSSFVSVLFSSFVPALLSRSLLCCSAGRRHFKAVSSSVGSNRDRAMLNSSFLRVLVQDRHADGAPQEGQQHATDTARRGAIKPHRTLGIRHRSMPLGPLRS